MLHTASTKKSLSFLEILVSALILTLSLTALLTTFVSVRKSIARSNERLSAFNLARQKLESLYHDVNASVWDQTGHRLSSGFNETSTATNLYPNIDYNITYTVSDVPINATDNFDYRNVTLNVTLPETMPE